ncbi:hypothetical protein [Rhizobium sp. PDO1-076]|uniref:hypothetical protein n=1 Tax=Rhizobium sp. PDO1-076 TaxID=1125979 RepID=UPI001FCC8DD8|nr:hypothetical protein [Rhizobium sp. PDO1-076]
MTGLDPHRLGRFDADIDIFREAVDDAVAFGERCAALQLEPHFQLLQALQSVHDPVVFFDQHRLNLHCLGDDAQQGREILMVMQEISWHARPLQGR